MESDILIMLLYILLKGEIKKIKGKSETMKREEEERKKKRNRKGKKEKGKYLQYFLFS